MIKRAGEQFMLDIKFTETTYSGCAQMVAVLYNIANGTKAATFVKVPDAKYPGAELIRTTADDHLITLLFRENLTKNLFGSFNIEFKLTYAGTDTPILKPVAGVITFKESHT